MNTAMAILAQSVPCPPRSSSWHVLLQYCTTKQPVQGCIPRSPGPSCRAHRPHRSPHPAMKLKNLSPFNAEYSSDGVSAMVLFRSRTIGGQVGNLIARYRERNLESENAHL